MGRALDLLSALFCSPKPLIEDSSSIPEALKPYLPPDVSPTDAALILRLRKEDLEEMNRLVQYFETPYDGLLVRGLKLMQLIKAIDNEEGKRLCVVDIDQESGQIVGMQDVVIN